MADNAPAGNSTPSEGQVPASQSQADNNVTPPANAQAPGEKKVVSISEDELNLYKRKAGRWDAQNDPAKKRDQRRAARGSSLPDDGDPDLLDAVKERDEKLSAATRENTMLKVGYKVIDLLESEDYKDLPAAVKKAIRRNPMGFTNPNSTTVEDMVADIQDFLDDESDKQFSSSGNQPANGQPATPAPIPTNNVPPVNGSGPTTPTDTAKADIAGKTGPARSTTILQNLLKNRTR